MGQGTDFGKRGLEKAAIKNWRFKKLLGFQPIGVLLPVTLAVAGLTAAITLFLSRARSVGVVDEDSYISFIYAQNLLAGEGLVFNPGGEKVEGITNLLWTLLVAAGTWITGTSLPVVSVTLGVACGVLILILAWVWGFEELAGAGFSWSIAAGSALAAPLLLSVAPGFAYYTASGLEVAFFSLLIMAGLYFLRGGGKLWCACAGSLLLGAAAMTRPEGALVLVLAAAAYSLWPGRDTYRGARRALAAALPGGVVLAAVTLWRLFYYGSPIPNTAFAKAGGFEVMERWGWPYIMEAAGQNWFHLAWLLMLFGAASHRGFLRRNTGALCVVPVWAAYIVYAGGDYMPFHRFVVPMLPILYTLAAVGMALVLREVLVSASTRLDSGLRAVVAAFPIVVLVSVFVSQVPEQVGAEEEHQKYLRDMRERREAAADWLDNNAPNSLVARNGVGAVGYYSDVRLLDMLGLNSEYIAHHGQHYPAAMPGHQTSDGEYVVSREPDYIMINNVEPPYRFASDRELAHAPEFRKEYERIKIQLNNGVETPIWKRKDTG